MPLGDFLLGLNLFEGMNSTGGTNPYNEITVNGQIIINDLRILNYVMTDAQLDTIALEDNIVWDSTTLFWADFAKSTLDAGNIIQLLNPVTSWDIKRFEQNSTSVVDIATVSAGITNYIDFTSRGNKGYYFILYPLSSSEVGTSLQTNLVTTSFDHWSITDYTTNEVFIIKNNINSGTGTHDIDRTTYPNFTKFEKISRGLRNFRKGTIQCMNEFDYITGYYDVDYISELEVFINNGNFKYLKTLKGELLIVDVFNFQVTYQDVIGEQPIMFSFDYEQVMDSPD